jgi:hypothetical protein
VTYQTNEALTSKHNSRTYGNCLCGSVSFTVPDSLSSFDACHCKMCLKWGGGPALSVEIDAGISWKGEEFVGVYSSSAWADRGFCTKCGTHLFYKLKESDFCNLPLGLFEDLEGWEFRSQIFIDRKPRCYDFSNQTEFLTEEEVFAKYSGC